MAYKWKGRHRLEAEPVGKVPKPEPETCCVEGCERLVEVYKRSMCRPHYSRRWKGPETCCVEGCENLVEIRKHTMCRPHYMRMWKGRDLDAPIKTDQECLVEGCEGRIKTASKRPFCAAHRSKRDRLASSKFQVQLCETD